MDRFYFKFIASPSQKQEYYKNLEKESQRKKNKRLRNQTPKQKEKARLKRIKLINYKKEQTKRRMDAKKEQTRKNRDLKCILKKGESSKKLKASDGKYGNPKGWYCHNCSHKATIAYRMKYCQSKGGKYRHNCLSCVYK